MVFVYICILYQLGILKMYLDSNKLIFIIEFNQILLEICKITKVELNYKPQLVTKSYTDLFPKNNLENTNTKQFIVFV